MNIDTGEIRSFMTEQARHEFMENLSQIEREKWAPIYAEDMTPKQREEMHVSPHDNRSPLGQQAAKMRKLRKAAKKWSKPKTGRGEEA